MEKLQCFDSEMCHFQKNTCDIGDTSIDDWKVNKAANLSSKINEVEGLEITKTFDITQTFDTSEHVFIKSCACVFF